MQKTQLGRFRNSSNMMFSQTSGSMFSDLKKKVTSWDKTAEGDPSMTQRVEGFNFGMAGDTLASGFDGQANATMKQPFGSKA